MRRLGEKGRTIGHSRSARRWLATCGAAFALSIAARPAHAIPLSILYHSVVRTVQTGSETLVNPSGVVVRSDGTLFIADFGASHVLRISPAGTTDVLDLALDGPEGLALDASGTLYIVDSGHDRIVTYTSDGNAGELNLGLINLSSPHGVTVDRSGTIYITDSGNNQIVQLVDGTASVLSLTGLSTPLSAPSGITSDASGNLYITDNLNNRVLEVTAGAASVVTFIDSLDSPVGVAIDPLGTLYVANQALNEVAEHALTGFHPVLETGIEALNGPSDVASDAHGVLYVSDTANARVLQVMPSTVDFGHVTFGASSGNTLALPFTVGAPMVGTVTAVSTGAAASDFQVVSTNCPSETHGDCVVSIEFNPTEPGLRRGAVTLVDTSQNKLITLQLFGIGDAPVAALAGSSSVVDIGDATLTQPFQVAFDGAGDMYVADYGGHQVLKVPPGGGSSTVVDTGSVVIPQPTGVAVDGAGNLYIAEYPEHPDTETGGIAVIAPGGAASELDLSSLSPPHVEPFALAVDANGVLYISDIGTPRVIKVLPNRQVSTLDVGDLDLGGQVTGVAVDSKGNVYLAAAGTHVFKVTPTGNVSTLDLSDFSFTAYGLAVDAFDNVYVVDGQNRRILMATTAGHVSAIPMPIGISGVAFNVALDGLGNAYIPAFYGGHVLRLDRTSAPLAFPDTFANNLSGEQSATLTNIGNQPLTFADDGSFAPLFSSVSDELRCRAISPVAPGGRCLVSAEFAPTSVGSYSATLTLTDDSLNQVNATQTVAASGVCIPDSTALAVTPGAAEVLLGNPVTLTVTVTDSVSERESTIPTGSVTFTDTLGSTEVPLNGGSPVELDSSGHATLEGVILDGAGAHTISANFASGAFASSSNTTSVVVTTAPMFAVAPADPFQFGSHQTGSHTVQTFTITNAGSGVLEVGTIALSGSAAAQYSIVADADHCSGQQVAAAGGTCTVDVSYDPSTFGASTVALSIPNSTGTQYVALSGTARDSDLHVRIVGLSPSVLVGEPMHYDVWVENLGGKPAAAPKLTFTLPEGTALVSASGAGWTCVDLATVVQCSSDSLAAQAIGILHFWLKAPESAGTISATFTATSESVDEDSENNSVDVDTLVNAGPVSADHWITLVAKPAPVEAGAVLTYTARVGNDGPNVAENVSVRFRLPSGVSLLAASGDGWSCGGATPVITCTKATSLGVGKPSTILVTVTAPSTEGNLSASASLASSTDDPDPSNDLAAVTTSVTASLTTPLVPTSSLDPEQALAVQNQGGCTLSRGATTSTGGFAGIAVLGMLAGFSGRRRAQRAQR